MKLQWPRFSTTTWQMSTVAFSSRNKQGWPQKEHCIRLNHWTCPFSAEVVQVGQLIVHLRMNCWSQLRYFTSLTRLLARRTTNKQAKKLNNEANPSPTGWAEQFLDQRLEKPQKMKEENDTFHVKCNPNCSLTVFLPDTNGYRLWIVDCWNKWNIQV